MNQLVQPNLNVKGTLGYCLVYVRDVFSAPWAGADAWTSWNHHTQFRHTDALPSGVYVPIWFDGYWNGERYGHTAVYKDGKVWSSPYKAGQSFAVLSSIAEVERIYKMKYVGWSEDIGGKRVVINKGEDMPTRSQIATMWLLANFKDLNELDAATRENIYAHYEKAPLQELLSDLSNGEGRKNAVKQYLAGANASVSEFEEVGTNTGLYQRKK